MSFICGEGDGLSFCGTRQLVVYDIDLDFEIDLTVSNIFAMDGQNIMINTISDDAMTGLHTYEVRVKL
jgi:hypothetical protein